MFPEWLAQAKAYLDTLYKRRDEVLSKIDAEIELAKDLVQRLLPDCPDCGGTGCDMPECGSCSRCGGSGKAE